MLSAFVCLAVVKKFTSHYIKTTDYFTIQWEEHFYGLSWLVKPEYHANRLQKQVYYFQYISEFFIQVMKKMYQKRWLGKQIIAARYNIGVILVWTCDEAKSIKYSFSGRPHCWVKKFGLYFRYGCECFWSFSLCYWHYNLTEMKINENKVIGQGIISWFSREIFSDLHMSSGSSHLKLR